MYFWFSSHCCLFMFLSFFCVIRSYIHWSVFVLSLSASSFFVVFLRSIRVFSLCCVLSCGLFSIVMSCTFVLALVHSCSFFLFCVFHVCLAKIKTPSMGKRKLSTWSRIICIPSGEGEQLAYNCLGINYYKLGNLDLALTMHTKHLEGADPAGKFVAHSNLGLCPQWDSKVKLIWDLMMALEM